MDDLKAQPPAKAEALLEALVATVTAEAVRVLSVPEESARLLADEVVTRFCQDFGGTFLYLPKGRVFHTSRLYREIYEAFTGNNVGELAERFDLSVIHVYRVIAKERARDLADRQRPLPGVPG